MSHIFDRRSVVRGLGAGVGAATLGLGACSKSDARQTRLPKGPPNIIFIMADDLGYADLSCYGRRDYSTPHVDSLAKDGLKYTHGYSNSAVCSATRLGLITGKYQYRFPAGLEEPIAINHIGIDPDVPTMPSELKRLGYETALIGKWHLGQLPDYGPLKSGYDHFFGHRSGAVDYYTHSSVGQYDLWDGEVTAEQSGYVTELIGNRAVEQIEQFAKRESPFFLSLHFTAPHWPWQAGGARGKQESDRLAQMEHPLAIVHYDGGDMDTYAKMVISMDDQVGRVLKALKDHDLDQNTIIVFTSDNGGERFSDNWPFTGQKSELLEGGIRVPVIIKWPGKIDPGSESDVPIVSMDWMPTLLAISNASHSIEFDGVNIMDTFVGNPLAERPLYWRFNSHDQKAVRMGKWKYLSISGNEFLFDIVADPRERGNLKRRHPEVFESLKARYETWNAQMLPYRPANFSGSIAGADQADHYGVLSGALGAE